MKNNKKILIFSTTYHPFVGGAEVAVKEITDRLGDDFEFDMVTLRFDNNLSVYEKIGNVGIYRLGFTQKNPNSNDLVKLPLKLNKLLFPFLACCKASGLHRKNSYDAIWSIMASYAGFGALFFKLSHPNIPYLLTLQEGDSIDYIKKKTRFVSFLFKRIFTKADFIQAISNYLGKWARDMGFERNLEIIPNAVNVAYFSQRYSEDELNELKKFLNKKIEDKFIITTSRLVKKNACDDVIKSLKYLSKNVKFIILGDGPDRQKLRDIAKKEGIKERVQFIGLVNHKDIPKYLKISDVFVRPSLSEGLGNSFLEAMAAEIPVIATQEGGIADFLFDAKRNPNKKTTGWAVDVRSPEQIARAVKEILDKPEKTSEVVAIAKKMVVEKYDWNIIAKDMKTKVFDKVLK